MHLVAASKPLPIEPVLFAVLLTGGILLLVGAILFIVFSLARRATARARIDLEAEGVELDSGPVTIKTRYRDFRAPGISAGAAVNLTRGHLVLTKRRLVVLKIPRRYGVFEREVLGRFQVGTEGDRLHIHSDEPPGAEGTVDYYVPVADTQAWIRALTAAGMRTI